MQQNPSRSVDSCQNIARMLAIQCFLMHLVRQELGLDVGTPMLCRAPADPGCQCGKELLIVAMGPGFKPLVRTFGKNPPRSGLVRRACPRSMGGKCVINA